MFTFLWLCIATTLGYIGGDHWMINHWFGAGIGFFIGVVLWAIVRLGSGDSVGDLFESIGDGFTCDFGGDCGGDGGCDGGGCD